MANTIPILLTLELQNAAPLDSRYIINVISEKSSILYPYVGLLFYVINEKALYVVTELDSNENVNKVIKVGSDASLTETVNDLVDRVNTNTSDINTLKTNPPTSSTTQSDCTCNLSYDKVSIDNISITLPSQSLTQTPSGSGSQSSTLSSTPTVNTPVYNDTDFAVLESRVKRLEEYNPQGIIFLTN